MLIYPTKNDFSNNLQVHQTNFSNATLQIQLLFNIFPLIFQYSKQI